MAIIKGKWKWNENFSDVQGMGILEIRDYAVAFTSNGEEYKGIGLFASATNDTPTGIYYNLVSYPTSYEYRVEVRSLEVHEVNNNGYCDWYTSATFTEAYRIMDFGEVEHYIDDAIYDFIVVNAEQILTTISEKFEVIAENEQKVYDAGKKAEYDAFWDVFQNYGSESGMSYNEVFGKGRFTDANYNPKYPIQVAVGINSGYAMFNGASNITDIKVPIYHRGTNLGYLFNSCGRLKRIPALHILADVTSFQAAFEGCNALEDITITGTIGENIDFKACTKLTRTSIESILNALSDTATDKTLTLSNDAVYEAFALRDDDGNKLPYLEGIWQEYIYIKSNWTITLV